MVPVGPCGTVPPVAAGLRRAPLAAKLFLILSPTDVSACLMCVKTIYFDLLGTSLPEFRLLSIDELVCVLLPLFETVGEDVCVMVVDCCAGAFIAFAIWLVVTEVSVVPALTNVDCRQVAP